MAFARDLQCPRFRHTSPAAAGRVEGVAFNTLLDLLATCGNDGRVIVMSVKTGKQVRGEGERCPWPMLALGLTGCGQPTEVGPPLPLGLTGCSQPTEVGPPLPLGLTGCSQPTEVGPLLLLGLTGCSQPTGIHAGYMPAKALNTAGPWPARFPLAKALNPQGWPRPANPKAFANSGHIVDFGRCWCCRCWCCRCASVATAERCLCLCACTRRASACQRLWVPWAAYTDVMVQPMGGCAQEGRLGAGGKASGSYPCAPLESAHGFLFFLKAGAARGTLLVKEQTPVLLDAHPA